MFAAPVMFAMPLQREPTGADNPLSTAAGLISATTGSSFHDIANSVAVAANFVPFV